MHRLTSTPTQCGICDIVQKEVGGGGWGRESEQKVFFAPSERTHDRVEGAGGVQIEKKSNYFFKTQ